MAETEIIAGFLDLLSLPLDPRQRLDVLAAMARQADWLSADDVLLAAALLDHAARHRVDGRELPVEQVAEIQSNYIDDLLSGADPEVACILAEALAVRQWPSVLN
jgi:hypothetical protein